MKYNFLLFNDLKQIAATIYEHPADILKINIHIMYFININIPFMAAIHLNDDTLFKSALHLLQYRLNNHIIKQFRQTTNQTYTVYLYAYSRNIYNIRICVHNMFTMVDQK